MPQQTGRNRLLTGLPGYFWCVVALAATADLITKHLVFRHFEQQWPAAPDGFPYPPIVILDGFIQIVRSTNRGGVFGLGQGSGLWLIFGLVAGVLVIWFAHRRDARHVLIQLALGLVLAGAVGNVFDRVAFGHVRDFIDVCYWPGQHWPAFNVADSGICVGAVYLAVHALFFAPREEAPPAKPGRKN